MTDLIHVIRESWGWTGIDPEEVVKENDFGNLVVRDSSGRYWRICPEEAYCKIIANDQTEFDRISETKEFLEDWQMTWLVEMAKESLGSLQDGRKYYLVIPGVIGGAYEASNIRTLRLTELIDMRGAFAKEIDGIPDGTPVKLKISD